MGSARAATALAPPLLLAATLAGAADGTGASGPFALDPAELDPIRFTRLPESAAGAGLGAAADEPAPPAPGTGPRTELSFSLSPRRPDFSLEGAYGLGALFGEPEFEVASAPPAAGFATDGAPLALPGDLNEGFRYSAGVRIEHEDADIDGTAYVSSSLLGLSYGRLGRLWYGGIDVNLEQFAAERYGDERPDVLSLDVTTGRRLGITGLGADAPLWLLSLRGDFDLIDAETDAALEPESAWYLNPQLFWRHPGFTFSAEMQVPVETATPSSEDDAKPDYRLRAVFEKRFK